MTAQNDGEQRERERLAALDRYEVLDTDPESAFDELVEAAAAIAGTPFASVTLVDEHRQWFKAFKGFSVNQTPRAAAICDLVVRDEDEVIIDDTLLEPRLATNPDVVGGAQYRFYAGFPLRTPEGAVLGTLCVVDQKPGVLSPEQLQLLRVLATQVMAQLQLRLELRQRDRLTAERERAFVQLEESERRYRFLVEQSSDVIAQHRPDGSVTYVSPTVFNLLDIPADADPLAVLRERLHPDDLEAAGAAWARVQAGERQTVTGRVMHPDGRHRYLETTWSPVRDDDGQVTEIMATTRDVTERRRAEIALEEARDALAAQSEMLEQAQELAQVGSWSADLLTDEVVWSRQAHRNFGTDPDMPVTTQTHLDFILPEDLPIMEAAIGRAFAEGTSDDTEFRLRRADGEVRYLRARFQVDQDAHGRPVRLSGTNLDITESRVVQQELLRARDLLNRVMSTSTKTSVVAVGADGRITIFNRGAEHMLGYSAEEMVGTEGYLRFHDLAEIRERVERYGLDDDPSHVFVRATELGDDEWTYIHKDGSRRVAQLSASHMVDENGDRAGSIGFMVDVTEARKAQQEVLEAKDRFEQLLDSATDQAIIGSDLAGTITIFNRGAENMLGLRAAEIVGTAGWPRFVLDGLGLDGLGVGHGQDGTGGRFDGHWRRQDGTELTVQVSVTPMRSAAGELVGHVAVGQDVTEQRRAEAALTAANAEAAERRQQMEEAQRLASVGSWTLDLPTGQVHWSPEMFRLTGVDPATPLTPESFQQIVHPDDLPLIESISRNDHEGESYSIEHRLVRPDGAVLRVVAHGRSERDEHGAVVKLHGAIQDVTQRRQTEDALVRANELFNQLLSSATAQAIIGTDTRGEVTIFNRGAELMLGYRADEVVGTTRWRQFHDPAELEQLMSAFANLSANDYSGENLLTGDDPLEAPDWTYIRKDGRPITVQIRLSPMRDSGGRIQGFVAIASDVTQQRRAEAELARASKELASRTAQLEEAQQIAGVGSWSADVTTGETVWSAQMYRIFGVEPGAFEVGAESMHSFVHPADRDALTRQLEEILAGDSDQGGFGMRIVLRDGSTRHLLTRFRLEHDPDGRPTRMIGTTQDVTQARRLEAEVVRANDLFNQLLSSATAQAIIGTDAGGRVTIFNRGAEQMLGYSAMEVVGTTDWHRFHEPEELPLIRSLYSVMRDEADEQAIEAQLNLAEAPDWTFVRADGSRIKVQIRFSPMRDAYGSMVGAVAIATDVTRQRQAEVDLSRASADLTTRTRQLEEAQHIAGVGSWSMEFPSGEQTWSAETYRILGYEPGSVPASMESLRARIHPQDLEVFEAAFGRLVQDPEADTNQEVRVILPGGSIRYVQTRAVAEFSPDGQIRRASGTVQDVTGIRRAERDLTEARDMFARVIEASTEQAIYVVDHDAGPIRLYNSGAERMLGYSAEEAIGSRLYFEWHDAAEVAEKSQRYGIPLQAGYSADVFLAATRAGDREWTLIHQDGSRREVLFTVNEMHDADGAATGYLCIATDVTQARRAERELRAARDQFVQLLRAATDQAIVGTGPDGTINLFNKGAESMLGYTAQEAFGRTPWRFLHDQDELAARTRGPHEQDFRMVTLQSALTGEGEREWTWVRKDGSRITVQLSLSPMRDENGQVSGYLGIATDVTERRAAEQERDRAEQEVQAALLAISQARDEAMAANQAKSAFLATMSHEIRTPMNAVIGMTGLLLDTTLDDEQRDLLETVRGSGDQLLAIINDILDFSKIEAGDLDLEYRGFDLRDLVEGTMAQFAGSAKGLDLISHVDVACPAAVAGDITRLRQVLSNLIGNAIKFTAEGDVLVQVQVADEPGPETDGNWRLRFEVRDTGIGIPADSMDRLFKSFSQVDASTTRNYGGTGLGLAISKALVQAMGGEIWVESELGAGSTFIFTVLLGPDDSQAPARPGRMTADELRTALSGRRALIVDDNDTNRRILELQLGGQDMRTVSIATPVDALRLLTEPEQQFDVAVLDLAMPVLDGVQLAAAIRRLPQRAGLPLLLLSSLGRRLGPDEDLFAAVLTKPVRSGSLLENIAKVVDAQPVRAADAVPAPRAEAAVPAVPAGAPTLRILLAEDNEVNQKVGRLMLAKLGHRIDIVSNGEEAVEAARAQEYDVILMDMHMPVMDGLEATRRIRAQLPAGRQPVIVALTASVTLEDREACAAAGMNNYLSKPVRPDELTDVLRQAQGAVHD